MMNQKVYLFFDFKQTYQDAMRQLKSFSE